MIKPGNVIRKATPFLIGASLILTYHLYTQYQQNQQIGHLISTSRELFGQQRFLISNYHDSFTTLYDCTFESNVCDLKVGTEKLQMLEKDRDQIIKKMNKADEDVANIIERNRWVQTDEITGTDKK